MIIQVIKNLGYNPTLTVGKVTINDKQLYDYMKQWSKGAPFKTLPEWVWKLDKDQCRLFIKHMILGDGTVGKKDTNKDCRYYTTSIKLADEFMKLCLHAGWSANKYLHIKKGHQSCIDGRIITSKYNVWRLGVIKDKNRPTINHSHVKKQNAQTEEIIKYSGPVFCLEMPTEIFYVRRSGKPVWTSNSRSRGPPPPRPGTGRPGRWHRRATRRRRAEKQTR